MSLGKNEVIYYLPQFPMGILNETLRFMLLITFLTKIFGLSMEVGSFFTLSLYVLLNMPLETENIPSVWLDQDVNYVMHLLQLISSNLTSLGDLWFDAVEPRPDTGFNVTKHKG